MTPDWTQHPELGRSGDLHPQFLNFSTENKRITESSWLTGKVQQEAFNRRSSAGGSGAAQQELFLTCSHLPPKIAKLLLLFLLHRATFCLLWYETTPCNKAQMLWLPNLGWLCTFSGFSATKGTNLTCAALQCSLQNTVLYLSLALSIAPLFFALHSTLSWRLGMSWRVLSTLQIQKNKCGWKEMIQWGPWEQSLGYWHESKKGNIRAKYLYGILKWWGPSPRRQSSSAARSFKNTQQTGPTE